MRRVVIAFVKPPVAGRALNGEQFGAFGLYNIKLCEGLTVLTI